MSTEDRNEGEATDPVREPLSDSPAPGAEVVLEEVYDRLRILAARRLESEPPGRTLQATALVHEAWLRVGAGTRGAWKDRNHFFAVAALAMRRILVDQARRRRAVRHGGGWLRVDGTEFDQLPSTEDAAQHDERLGRIEAALDAFSQQHPARAELIRLRFYTGLTIEESAKALRISAATAKRYWTFGRAWLFRELTRGMRER